MKKFLILLSILLLAAGTLNAQGTGTAQDPWQIGAVNPSDVTATLIDSTLTITGTGAMMNWGSVLPLWYDYNPKIQSVIVGDEVTTIGMYAFYGLGNMTSVTIGNGVTSIGGHAFASCNILTSITIPDKVTRIGDFAFSHCYDLASVTIPDKVTSIGDYVFYYCTNLTSVTIPNGVTSIGEGAFTHCEGLTNITFTGDMPELGMDVFTYVPALNLYYPCDAEGWDIYAKPDNVTVMATGTCWDISATEADHVIAALINGTLRITGTGAMKDLSKGTISPFYYLGIENLTIGDGITSIGNYMFQYCSSLTSVTLGDNVTTIGNAAFYDCSNLTSVIIPDKVTRIVDYAFYGCGNLTSVTLGDSVMSIGAGAFYGCSGLTSITIPDKVTSIGDFAFRGCSSLTSATLGNSVTSIGYDAFKSCSGLKDITFEGDMPTFGASVFDYVPALTLHYYCENAGWDAYIAPSNVTVVPNHVLGEWGAWEFVKETSCTDSGLMIRTLVCKHNNTHIIDIDTIIIPQLTNCDELVGLRADTARLNQAVNELVNDTIRLFDLLTLCESGSSAVKETAEAMRVSLYPNPVVNDELTIDNEHWVSGQQIEIYTMSGARVSIQFTTGRQTTINVSTLPVGTYVIKAGQYIGKFVKK